MKKKTEADKVAEALDALIDMYISNRGTDHEFISCITPKHASQMTFEERSQSQVWRAWDTARIALADFQSKTP